MNDGKAAVQALTQPKEDNFEDFVRRMRGNVSQEGGNITSHLSTLGQRAKTDEIPEEMRTMLAQLPKWIEQRAGALERIKQVYDNDLRMRETPLQALAKGMFRNGRPGDVGYGVAMGQKEEDALKQYQIANQLAREKSVLEGLDLGTFDKLYSSVAKQMAPGRSRGFSGHTTDGGLAVLNNETGVVDWAKSPVGAAKVASRIAEEMTKEMIKQGVDPRKHFAEIQEASNNYAKLYLNAPSEIRARIDQGLEMGQGTVTKPVLDTIKGGIVPGRVPTIEGQFTPQEKGAIVADISKDGNIVPPSLKSAQPMFRTPEELEMSKKQYENYANEYKEDVEAAKSVRNMAPSIDAMKAVLSNPKLVNVGPLHDQLTKLGGYISYIDPNNILVQSVNNTPVYFSNMMNLVRDKIKALGAGTAVSNLDLIVTQKSVGDLRNTVEGNKKLLAIMELQNATLLDKAAKKISYFESGKQGYKGWNEVAQSLGNEPTHIVRRDPESGNYFIQSKSDWLEEQAKFNNTTPDKIEKYWKQKANEATSRLVSGTSIQFKGQ